MAEVNNEELALKARNTLGTMLDYLGLNAELKAEVTENNLALKIKSTEPGRIIGRKGQTLESLQLLVNRMMFKLDEECPHITLDIDGYAAGDRESKEARNEGDENAPQGRERGEYRRRSRHDSAPRTTVEQLEKQAKDSAKEVKRWGEPVKLPEMNAHDRRIIHLTLQDDPEITTESEGEGNFKKVVVSLKKAE